jgi:hypothetical protein
MKQGMWLLLLLLLMVVGLGGIAEAYNPPPEDTVILFELGPYWLFDVDMVSTLPNTEVDATLVDGDVVPGHSDPLPMYRSRLPGAPMCEHMQAWDTVFNWVYGDYLPVTTSELGVCIPATPGYQWYTYCFQNYFQGRWVVACSNTVTVWVIDKEWNAPESGSAVMWGGEEEEDDTLSIACDGDILPNDAPDSWYVDDVVQPGIRWTIRNGSLPTGTIFPGKWDDVEREYGIAASTTFSRDSLPTDNADFGLKTARWQLFDPDAPSREIFDLYTGSPLRVYYWRDATNHPGGTTPNWYYYWSQTVADSGTHEYEAGSGYGSYTAGDNHFHLKDGATGTNSHTGHTGIDCFAEKCLYFAAKQTHWQDWHGQTDTDGDGVPNSVEDVNSNQQYDAGDPSNWNDADTDDDGQNDEEELCLAAEDTWEVGSATEEDWARPGHQYY